MRKEKAIDWPYLSLIVIALGAVIIPHLWLDSTVTPSNQPITLQFIVEIPVQDEDNELKSPVLEKTVPQDVIILTGNLDSFILAEERFGVHVQTLYSQWKRESDKGTNIGTSNPCTVLNHKQLEAYEQICLHLDIAPASRTVSVSGDMGPMQFQPATWLAYGLDGNRDGKADPWDLPDAVMSSANYLSVLGYAQSPWTALAKYNGGNKFCRSSRAQRYASAIIRSAIRQGASITL